LGAKNGDARESEEGDFEAFWKHEGKRLSSEWDNGLLEYMAASYNQASFLYD
jgi:hypothetical protein